jgi:Chaperone of endosialidase
VKNATPILFMLSCLAFSRMGQAVSPPPDGGYPGGNTAEGQNALLNLTTGTYNTAVGWVSLESVTTSELNTAVGAAALVLNTANENTATGAGALLSNTTGQSNTGDGVFALLSNNTGNSNTAIGDVALLENTIGNANTAVGFGALTSNTSGGSNTAIGIDALASNTTGNGNVAVGGAAGSAIGTANGVVAIQSPGGNVDNSTWIGNVFGVTSVSGTTAPVVVSDGGQLATLPSSRQFKKDIQPMEEASRAILGLKPVTFHYRSDKTNIPQFGLIAEEVAAVDSNLVGRNDKGEIYTVRYDAVNAMLLNEFLKEHRIVQEQGVMISRQQKQIDALTASLQKISAKFELTKSDHQSTSKKHKTQVWASR